MQQNPSTTAFPRLHFPEDVKPSLTFTAYLKGQRPDISLQVPVFRTAGLAEFLACEENIELFSIDGLQID